MKKAKKSKRTSLWKSKFWELYWYVIDSNHSFTKYESITLKALLFHSSSTRYSKQACDPFLFSFSIKSEVDIRRACIKILLSLLSYPHHFEDLPIKGMKKLLNHLLIFSLLDTLTETTTTTFHSLKPRLTNLLIQSFYGEQDSTNIQMILGKISSFIKDFLIN